jgi:hypothetical protein
MSSKIATFSPIARSAVARLNRQKFPFVAKMASIQCRGCVPFVIVAGWDW